MGGCATKINPKDDNNPERHGELRKQGSVFKQIKTDFDKEGNLDYNKKPDYKELRVMLEDPIGQRYFGNYTKAQHTNENMFAWVDIHEYRDIPTKDYRRCCAVHIYQKYIKDDAVMALGFMTDKLREPVDEALAKAKETHSASITKELFDEIFELCFKEMVVQSFTKFKKEAAYAKYKKEMDTSYNKVVVDDFDYMGLLGQGGFGRVAHVRKTSTMSHYAMKIQLKAELLREYKGDESHLNTEKKVFSACHHPFVVDLAYAIQTEQHAILILGLVRAGDLEDAMMKDPQRRLEADRVYFYMAEISLALQHMHDLGMLYRDLKPCNILLTEEGHVQLTDMGLAAEVEPDNASHHYDDLHDHTHDHDHHHDGHNETRSPTLKAESKGGNPNNLNNRGATKRHKDDYTDYSIDVLCKAVGDAKPDRRKSIVGTPGFMAPEMINDKDKHRRDRQGYCTGVDYYALGVTMYQMLTGKLPEQVKLEMKLGKVRAKPAKGDCFCPPNWEIFYPDSCTDLEIAFMSELMVYNVGDRLGCDSKRGQKGLRDHPYYEGLDWDLLLVKGIPPPFLPRVKKWKEDAKPKYVGYQKMMKAFSDKDNIVAGGIDPWDESPSVRGEKYFESWDYISPQTFRLELGYNMDHNERSANLVGHAATAPSDGGVVVEGEGPAAVEGAPPVPVPAAIDTQAEGKESSS